MSFVLDIPQCVVFALALALPAGAENHLPADTTQATSRTIAVASDRGASARPCGFRWSNWLRALKTPAAKQHYASYSDRVFRTTTGLFYVPLDEDRRAIRRLLFNREAARRLAIGLAQANSKAIRKTTGVSPRWVGLYLAHRLGWQRAVELINLRQTQPQASAYFYLVKSADGAPSDAGLLPRKDMTLERFFSFIETSLVSAVRSAHVTDDWSNHAWRAGRPSLRGARSGREVSDGVGRFSQSALASRAFSLFPIARR